MTGQTISHYRVLDQIGTGGMGVVFRAEDLNLHRAVALKFLAPDLRHHRDRFLREARAAAALNHPNICTIYEVDEQLGFIAMEVVDGCSVKEKINRRPLPVNEALDVALQACAGLQAAHDKGIVHRDVKPANLMINKQGLVKIMDFGLAQTAAQSRITESGTAVGTPVYMSPEQLQCKPVDRRTDLWSLGVVLYEMLAGRLPFAGDSAVATTFGIVHGDPEPLTAVRSQLPQQLDRVMNKVLRKDPDQRYSTADDFAADLRAIASGRNLSRAPGRRKMLYAAGTALAACAGGGLWFFSGFRGSGTGIDSLAVLPLENLSTKPEQDYFADGITEELIGEIARIGSLRVISRTSVMPYRKTNKSIPSIARELHVDGILTGTVAQSNDKVRITAQLIRARDERLLWSEKFERSLADVIALQGEVARSVARGIQIQLTAQQTTSLTRNRTVNPEAYERFLRANQLLYAGVAGVARSIELFTAAIQLDNTFAEAYAGLAQALIYAGIFGLRPSFQVNPEARAAALKALQLDSSSAAAHTVLADVKKGYDWDLPAAESEYQASLRLNPSHLMTRLWYAECLSRMRRYDDSIAESRRGLALEPVSPLSHNNLTMLLYRARRNDEAIAECDRALELDRAFLNAYWWRGLALAAKKDFPAAIASLRQAVERSPAPLFRANLAYVLALSGDRHTASKTVRELVEASKHAYVSPADVSVIYLGLGDADSVFQWLDQAYQKRDASAHAVMMPHYDTLRSDSRYEDFVKRVGLPA